MTTSPLHAALGSLALWGFGICGWGFAQEVAAFDKLQRGMTPEQVREQVGSPQRIARQFLYHRYVEQWIYDRPVAARLQFDCPRGQKPRLIWKQVPAQK
jgi:hypothetical protein